MTRYPSLPLFLLLFAMIHGLAQTPSTLKKTNEKTNQAVAWKALEDSSYSIHYPPAWELNKSGQMGTAFILLSPLPSEKDAFRENVNLLVQDLTGHNMDLGKYTEISVEQIKTMLPKSIVIENKRVSDSGREHQRLIYTGDQGQFRLKFQQYYWVKNEKAFVLTLTCEEEKFDLYKADGEMVLNSFRLK